MCEVSFCLVFGELVVFLGFNGVGKISLLRSVLNIEGCILGWVIIVDMDFVDLLLMEWVIYIFYLL